MIIYTIGNINLETVSLVAKMISRNFGDQNISVEKVVVFNSKESAKKHSEQAEIYRAEFGDGISIEDILIDENGLVDTEKKSYLFNQEGEKIFDITNGQKTTAALLFMVASLLKIDYVFYLKLKVRPNDLPENPVENIHFDLIKLPTYTSLDSIAKISQFDLIYYLSELEKIFSDSKTDLFNHNIKSAIFEFFKDGNPKNIVSSATLYVERLKEEMFEFISENEITRNFIDDHLSPNSKWNPIDKDKLHVVDFFFRELSKNPKNYDGLVPLVTIPGLMLASRNYRNLAAHNEMNGYTFNSQDARIVINIALEVFRICKSHQDLWSYLNR